MDTFVKSLLSLVLLFLIVGFSSCKKETFDAVSLLGTWGNEEWGGKNDPNYSKTETYKFEKFDIGMYWLEEYRGDQRLDYREHSFSYSLFENTLTMKFANGDVRVRNISIDKNLLFMVGDTTRIYTRLD